MKLRERKVGNFIELGLKPHMMMVTPIPGPPAKLTVCQYLRNTHRTALSANITETPAPLGITVGRWR